MKNIVLRMIMAACLLMVIGTASAAVNEFHLTEENANEEYKGDIDVLIRVNDADKTIELDLSQPVQASMKTVLINVPVSQIQSVTDDNPYVSWKVSNDNSSGNAGFGAMLTSVESDKNKGTVQYIKIQMSQDWDGVLPTNPENKVGNYTVVVHVIKLPEVDGISSVWLGYQNNNEDNGGPVQEIPEFPTVALPIAAILGLAFMFQRRKE